MKKKKKSKMQKSKSSTLVIEEDKPQKKRRLVPHEEVMEFFVIDPLPDPRPLNPNVPHAPVRVHNLSKEEKIVSYAQIFLFESHN